MAKLDKKLRVVLAAGGVLWRRNGGSVRIALIRRNRYGEEWSLPKGKLEEGESFEMAALREVLEETCCEASIGGFVGAVDYYAGKRPKVVLFYDMELEEEREFIPSDEVGRLEWIAPEEALERLSYGTEREVMRRWIANDRSEDSSS